MHFMKEKKIINILKQCSVIAENSVCQRRRFGAIITTPEGVQISGGYNGSIRGAHNCGTEVACAKNALNKAHDAEYDVCGSVHAEVNAILNAARSGSGIPLRGAVMFLNSVDAQHAGIPCRNCRRNIINTGIAYIYYYNSKGTLIRTDTGSWIGEENRWLSENRYVD